MKWFVSVNPKCHYLLFYRHLRYHHHVLRVISLYEQEFWGSCRKEHFILLWKINHFISGVHIQVMHLSLLLLQIFWNSLWSEDDHKSIPRHEQVCLMSLIKHTCSWRDKLIVLCRASLHWNLSLTFFNRNPRFLSA